MSGLSILILQIAGIPALLLAWPPAFGSADAEEKSEIRWVAGDMHMHTEALPLPDRPDLSLTPRDLFEELEREALEVGAVLAWGVRPHRTAAFFTGRDTVENGRLLHYDLEVSSFGGSYVDHVIALGLEGLDFPRRLYTLPVLDWAREQGAVVGVAHASHWPADPDAYPDRTTQVPAELPLCLALGRSLFLGTEALAGQGFLNLWYGLLNCGFRVPLAGGSDWPVAGTRAGDTRTYVALRGELTYAKWIEGIRRGRTVVARGKEDFLLLEVGPRKALPGDQVDLPAGGGELSVRILARQSRAGTVEIVVNGQVAASLTLGEGVHRTAFRLPLRDSAWLALRSERTHSGAVYVTVDGRPIRASSRDAGYFHRYVDVLLQQLGSRRFVRDHRLTRYAEFAALEAERARAIEAYAPAREVFAAIYREAVEREKSLEGD